MTDTLYIDIETRAKLVDLKKSSVYRYVEDPEWGILMAGWALNDDPVEMAFGYDDINSIPGLWDPAVEKVAHNAPFERINFSRFAYEMGATDEWPTFLPPEEWTDTMALAAEAGYPRSLDQLGKALGGEKKDAAGTALVNFFCKPNRRGQWNRPEDHPEKWAAFVEYCRQDVVTLRDVHKALPGWPTEAEREAFMADQRINDRGVRVDQDMLEAAVDAVETNKMVDELALKQVTGLDNPNSPQQLLAWFQMQGLKSMKDLRAETVERVLASRTVNSGTPKANTVKRALELRQDLALVTGKKYLSANASVSQDGRLRGQYMFFGAHTGRWSSRGVQVHNLTRAAFSDHKVKGDTCTCGREGVTEAHAELANVNDAEAAIIDLLMSGADSETLKKLIRTVFLIDGTVVDYSAIEARVIAWLAGEQWVLDAFRKGRDIYVETAARMSTPGNTLTRSQGKVAVLALGYNGGINSLRAMGGEGTDDELRFLVQAYRRQNPKIVQLWNRLGEAFQYGGSAGLLTVEARSADRLIWLPSGRAIVYHDVRLGERIRFEDENGKWVTKVSDTFASPRTYGVRVPTYGGRLSENVTQAVARDLLAAALVRLDKAGYPVVGHVHDEILVENVQDVEAVRQIMCDSPSWAAGLPVGGEGFVCRRYRKG